MDYKQLQSLLNKYMEGETSVAEEKQLKKYFQNTSEVHPDFAYAQAMFGHFVESKKDYFTTEESTPTAPKHLVSKTLVLVLFIIIPSVTYLLWINTNNSSRLVLPQTPKYFYVENLSDSVKMVEVNPHLTVWLNKEGSIHYPQILHNDHNRIQIKGEAYLEFQQSDTFSIEILAENALVQLKQNTAININAKEHKESIEITVRSGTIQVTDEHNAGQGLKLLVTAGNYCSVHRSHKIVFAAANRNNNYLAWKTGELVFDHMPMATVSDILEDYYGIEVELTDRQLAYCQFTGTFKNQDLKTVLESLQSSLDFEINTV
ncbi:MAG: DUF4974 domain-containing protein, partial [Saprospiraceae bacterium]|nr:DUF4974 domain-containing protein [Saprospiraceae bacterium]